MLDVKFAYSSNGDGFMEHDFITGKERQLSMDEFPTEEELIARWKSELNNGEGIEDNELKIIDQPYYSSSNTYDPRYYQRNAINRTVEAIAKGQNRLLLVMATGFRVIIVTEANSQVNMRVFRLLPKLKTEKLSGWCTV